MKLNGNETLRFLANPRITWVFRAPHVREQTCSPATSPQIPPNFRTSSASAALGGGALTAPPHTHPGRIRNPAAPAPTSSTSSPSLAQSASLLTYPSVPPYPPMSTAHVPEQAAPIPHLDCPHGFAAGVLHPDGRCRGRRELSRTLLGSHHTLLTTFRKPPVASKTKTPFFPTPYFVESLTHGIVSQAANSPTTR